MTVEYLYLLRFMDPNWLDSKTIYVGERGMAQDIVEGIIEHEDGRITPLDFQLQEICHVAGVVISHENICI